MCTPGHDLPADARVLLGALLSECAAALAAEKGLGPSDVRIGPVDFGVLTHG